MLFLCENMGKRLGDTIINRFGKELTARRSGADVNGFAVTLIMRLFRTKNRKRSDDFIIFFYSLFLFAEDLRYCAGVAPYFFLKAFIK